jgi:hypothetical protein
MTDYDINLVEGDSEDIKFQVFHNNIKVDLTPFDVTFNMDNDVGDYVTIDCRKGYIDTSTTPAIVYLASDGYFTIPFIPRSTGTAGVFKGQAHLTKEGLTRAWPLGKYISVKIWDAV